MSLGGSQTTKQEIPAWLEAPSIRAIQRGEDISRIGYVPYYGPDIAALTPMQTSAMQNAANAAAAFGLTAPTDVMAGMPVAQDFAGGVRGYSSQPLYQQSLDALQAARPGQFDYLNSFFINPFTGQGQPAMQPAMQPAPPVAGYMPTTDWREERDPGMDRVSSGSGYTGFRDMFDGGGPGKSGSTFSGGGLLSSAANRVASPVERDGGGGGGSK
jgi:hypothetical protein